MFGRQSERMFERYENLCLTFDKRRGIMYTGEI